MAQRGFALLRVTHRRERGSAEFAQADAHWGSEFQGSRLGFNGGHEVGLPMSADFAMSLSALKPLLIACDVLLVESRRVSVLRLLFRRKYVDIFLKRAAAGRTYLVVSWPQFGRVTRMRNEKNCMVVRLHWIQKLQCKCTGIFSQFPVEKSVFHC